jgi:hypothetical protein
MNGYHATSYNNSITLTDNDVIALAEKSGLDKKTAKMIQDEPKNFFSFWVLSKFRWIKIQDM